MSIESEFIENPQVSLASRFMEAKRHKWLFTNAEGKDLTFASNSFYERLHDQKESFLGTWLHNPNSLVDIEGGNVLGAANELFMTYLLAEIFNPDLTSKNPQNRVPFTGIVLPTPGALDYIRSGKPNGYSNILVPPACDIMFGEILFDNGIASSFYPYLFVETAFSEMKKSSRHTKFNRPVIGLSNLEIFLSRDIGISLLKEFALTEDPGDMLGQIAYLYQDRVLAVIEAKIRSIRDYKDNHVKDFLPRRPR